MTQQASPKPLGDGSTVVIDILLVEDDPADQALAREALRLGGLRHRLWIAVAGQEALLALRQEGAHAGMPRPHVVLLDLGLPDISGHAVLGAMKLDPTLRSIPVVVLTSTSAEDKRIKSRNLHAAHHIVKPVALDAYAGELRILEAVARV